MKACIWAIEMDKYQPQPFASKEWADLAKEHLQLAERIKEEVEDDEWARKCLGQKQ